MKFDDLYPEAKHRALEGKHGVLRGRFMHPCHACLCFTYWIDWETGDRVCSEECQQIMKGVNHE